MHSTNSAIDYYHSYLYLFNCVGHLFLLFGFFISMWLYELFSWIHENMTTSTVTSTHFQPIRHYHLKNRLKTRCYATIRALEVAILNRIQYDNVEYSSHETDSPPTEIENFVNLFDPKEPFK